MQSEKPKKEYQEWHNAPYNYCGCGQYERIVDGKCAECWDAEYEAKVEEYYIKRIKSLENYIKQLEEQDDDMESLTMLENSL